MSTSFSRLAGALPRRSFLFYSGAVSGALLVGCSDDKDPAPAAPAIASFAPASGMPGASIVVSGSNFTSATVVSVGGVAATFTVSSATSLTLTVPPTAQTGAISVTTPGGTASSGSAFTVLPLSTNIISGFSPTSGAPGTVVTVMGNGFTGATAVAVGGVTAAFTVVSATSLTFTVPVAAATGPIVVTTPGGPLTSATAFTVLPPSAVSVGVGDVGVLNYAYALEQLEAAFYTAVRTGSYYQGLAPGSAERQILDDLYYHEVIHREFLKAALTSTGTGAIKTLTPNFSSVDFSSRAAVLSAAKAFEDLGVAAYNGAAQYITSPAYLHLLGKIVSVEARHAALVRNLISEVTFVGNDVATLFSANNSTVFTNNAPANSSLERARSPAEVVPIVNVFLAADSKLDVSGIG